MKTRDEYKDDGHVNRDGITQGSGYGDTKAKARDAEASTPETDYDKALKEKSSTDDSLNTERKLPNADNDESGRR